MRNIQWYKAEPYDDYSAMQWPAPDGFHVPLNTEWQAVYNIRTTLRWSGSTGTDFGTALKLPFAGERFYTNANAVDQGSYGNYWSSSRYNADSAFRLQFYSSGVNAGGGANRAYGFSVRCFKDTSVEPTNEVVAWPISSGGISPSTQWPTLSLWTATKSCVCTISWSLYGSSGGWVTYADLYKNGTYVTAASSGFISWSVDFTMQVSVASWDVLTLQTSRWSSWSWAVNNVYVTISNWWTTLYNWSSVANWAWIFHNSALEIISMSSDWTTWKTIADKNLWATTVWNSWDTLSETNCGKYYQWWNNYWFPFTWSVTASSTQVDASSYWPWNYYSSDTFIKYSWRWDTTDNKNLRWWVTWVKSWYRIK